MPGWYMDATGTVQYFQTKTLMTSGGYYLPDPAKVGAFVGEPHFSWDLRQFPQGKPGVWSENLKPMPCPADKQCKWAKETVVNDKNQPGGRPTDSATGKSQTNGNNGGSTEKKGADASATSAATPMPAPPFKGNKTTGQLVTEPVPPLQTTNGSSNGSATKSSGGNAEPNEALKELLDKEKVPWYKRAWAGIAGAYAEAVKNVSAIFDAPLDGFIGLLKGVGNMFSSDLANLLIFIGKLQDGSLFYATWLQGKALALQRAGDTVQANQLASTANELLTSGFVPDLFTLSNDAQRGGSFLSMFLPTRWIAAVGNGIVKSVRVGRTLSEAAQATKVEEAIAKGGGAAAGSARQAEAAAGKAEAGAAQAETAAAKEAEKKPPPPPKDDDPGAALLKAKPPRIVVKWKDGKWELDRSKIKNHEKITGEIDKNVAKDPNKLADANREALAAEEAANTPGVERVYLGDKAQNREFGWSGSRSSFDVLGVDKNGQIVYAADGKGLTNIRGLPTQIEKAGSLEYKLNDGTSTTVAESIKKFDVVLPNGKLDPSMIEIDGKLFNVVSDGVEKATYEATKIGDIQVTIIRVDGS